MTPKIRTLIVDDEQLPRMELKLLLKSYPEIELIGEASDAPSGKKIIQETNPDLLFLDIRMPGEDGFSLLASLAEVPPHVIFTSAHDEYALRAFEVNAFDYMLKPVNKGRLQQAITKILNSRQDKSPSNPSAEETPVPQDNPFGQFFIKDGEQCWFIRPEDIELVESEGYYSKLFFKGKSALIKRTLQQLEDKLPEDKFFRASRQHLVNFDWVTDIKPMFSGRLNLTLKNGQEIAMSRRASQRLKNLMSI